MSDAAPARITPVILSGGAGTRLWPLSRLDRLKPMVDLTGQGTMLQLTAARVADSALFDPPVLVASGEDSNAAVAQLAAGGAPPGLTIEEPVARGTAVAIALAALALGPDSTMLVMPSDHVIGDEQAFLSCVRTALPVALEGWLVTFAIAPDRPETGYGYIKQGAPIAAGANRVERFAEKPDLATATAWLGGGGYWWNAGIFLMRSSDYLQALSATAPAVLVAARAAVEAASREEGRIRPALEPLASSPTESIDRAVLEHWDRVAMVPAAIGWSDVGNWESVHSLGPSDQSGNVVTGEAIAVDSRGCLVRSEGPVVVALGVEDLVIVATERAVLVVPRGQTQRVGQAIEALEKRRDGGISDG